MYSLSKTNTELLVLKTIIVLKSCNFLFAKILNLQILQVSNTELY